MKRFVFWCHGDGILHEKEFTGSERHSEARAFYDSLDVWKKEITSSKERSFLHPDSKMRIPLAA